MIVREISKYLLTIAALIASAFAQQPVRFDSGTISGLPARNIGSAMMSGRIAAVDAYNDNGRITVFVGSASGGVWKSINGGSTFKPVFDTQPVQSIGAVAIDPSNHKNVWVGTGEAWVRNSVSLGDGVYKSTDGGENWTNVGLKNSERIVKIIVNPKSSDTVLACVTGPAFSDSDERGVYKTTDGGKTWNKTLAGANGSTGCGQMTAALSDPNTIYATTWDYRRQAWTFRSGGAGSGVFKSTDGGDHWTEIKPEGNTGLPAKPWGRIAIAVAPSKNNVVYAMVECAKSALYRSDDGGATWKKEDASQYMVWRPFYFSNIIVDPKNENKVFKVDLALLLSSNGGRSFSQVSGSAHGDFHDVWIDPTDSNTIIAGDDGGLWRSLDGGTQWEHFANLPVSQFYHVSVDNDDPYHVFGGLQDNSSWQGDSSYPGGVTNSRWENFFGGDGFWMWRDPADSNYIYAEAQGGEMGRVNRETHEIRAIKPYPHYGEKKLRFNWNTPIQVSPNDKNTLYVGCEFLYKSTNQGQTWQRISPDLTTNNPEKQKQEESGGVTIDNSAAEMNNTIYSISESPKNAQVIWVGTDDGNIQVTQDGGAHWTKVNPSMPEYGTDPWITWVEASRYDPAVAYATVDRHMYGDMTPHLIKTTDYGKTWTMLPVADSGVRGYAHVIKEDTVKSDLLFLGTEFGLWVSIDGGQHWAQYRATGFPSVAVRDLVIHPRTSDLVMATHGRGIWIIDNIQPWRELTTDVMQQEAAFLKMTPAIQYIEAFAGWAEGDNSYSGPSRPGDAQIPYYQRSRHIFGDLKIDIFDADGKFVDTIASSKHRGINRATWNMHLKGPTVPPAASALYAAAAGPRVLPGTYTVKMTKGDKTYTTKLEIVLDPRVKFTVEDRKVQFALATRLADQLNHMSWAVDQIIAVRDGAQQAASKLKDTDPLKKQLDTLAADADTIRKKVVATTEGGAITGEERLREFMGGLYGDVVGYDGRPTDEQVARADALERELKDVITQFQSGIQSKIPAVNKSLASHKLPEIQLATEEKWRAAHASDGGAPSGGSMERMEGRFERD